MQFFYLYMMFYNFSKLFLTFESLFEEPEFHARLDDIIKKIMTAFCIRGGRWFIQHPLHCQIEEEEAISFIKVLEQYYSHEWLEESFLQITNCKNQNINRENYTIVHLSVMGGFFRLLHEIHLDQYNFDVDFYQPGCQLTLLHIIAKYHSKKKWEPERAALIKSGAKKQQFNF